MNHHRVKSFMEEKENEIRTLNQIRWVLILLLIAIFCVFAAEDILETQLTLASLFLTMKDIASAAFLVAVCGIVPARFLLYYLYKRTIQTPFIKSCNIPVNFQAYRGINEKITRLGIDWPTTHNLCRKWYQSANAIYGETRHIAYCSDIISYMYFPGRYEPVKSFGVMAIRLPYCFPKTITLGSGPYPRQHEGRDACGPQATSAIAQYFRIYANTPVPVEQIIPQEVQQAMIEVAEGLHDLVPECEIKFVLKYDLLCLYFGYQCLSLPDQLADYVILPGEGFCPHLFSSPKEHICQTLTFIHLTSLLAEAAETSASAFKSLPMEEETLLKRDEHTNVSLHGLRYGSIGFTAAAVLITLGLAGSYLHDFFVLGIHNLINLPYGWYLLFGIPIILGLIGHFIAMDNIYPKLFFSMIWIVTVSIPMIGQLTEVLRVEEESGLGFFTIDNCQDSVMLVADDLFASTQRQRGYPFQFIGKVPSDLQELNRTRVIDIDEIFYGINGVGMLKFTLTNRYQQRNDIFVGQVEHGFPKGYGIMFRADGGQVEGEWDERELYGRTRLRCSPCIERTAYHTYYYKERYYYKDSRQAIVCARVLSDQKQQLMALWHGKRFVGYNATDKEKREWSEFIARTNHYVRSHRHIFEEAQQAYKPLYERYQPFLSRDLAKHRALQAKYSQ